MRNLDVALDALRKGIAPVPCRPGAKTPMVPWKRWQRELPTEEEVERLFADTRVNVAVVTTGHVIFDCDVLEKARLVLEECGDTPSKIRTPRGLHLRYRRRAGVALANVVGVKGMPIDIRTDGGIELVPHSRTADGVYQWFGEHQELRPVAELPVANIGWTRERVRRVVTPEVIDDTDRAYRRARGYLATIEGSVSGQQGHNRAFRVANVLVVKFRLTKDQAFALMWEWNVTQCEPPFSAAEVRHKLDDAWKRRQ